MHDAYIYIYMHDALMYLVATYAYVSIYICAWMDLVDYH